MRINRTNSDVRGPGKVHDVFDREVMDCGKPMSNIYQSGGEESNIFRFTEET